MLSLAPESISAVLQTTNTDPRVVIYIAHSMQLQAHYLEKLNNPSLANLRLEQAKALAESYNFDLPENIDDVDDELFNEEEFLNSIEQMAQI